MKSITIKYEPFDVILLDPVSIQKGFSIDFEEGKKNATFCTWADFDDEDEKKVPAGPAVEFWNGVQDTVNLQTVLKENELIVGCDGYQMSIELSCGFNALKLTLWPPEKDRYQECGMTESYKLMVLIERLIDKLNKDSGILDFFSTEN